MASETTKRATLALVGKHPGWADFLWLGLDKHPLLERAASVLYEGGIVRNLQGSVWGDPRQQMAEMLERCRHVWLWRSGPHAVVGRLVPSRDAGGRTLPLLAMAQWTEVSPGHAVQLSLPVLVALEDRLAETPTAAEAEEILAQSEQFLTSLAARDPRVAVSDGAIPLLPAEEEEEWRAAWLQAAERAAANSEPAHLRLPAASLSAEDLLAKWSRRLDQEVGERGEFLVLVPASRAWVDVLFGPLGKPEHFAFLLRSDPPRIPEIAAVAESRADRLRRQWQEKKDEGLAVGRIVLANRSLALSLGAALLLLVAMVLMLRGCEAPPEEDEALGTGARMACRALPRYVEMRAMPRERRQIARNPDATTGQD